MAGTGVPSDSETPLLHCPLLLTLSLSRFLTLEISHVPCLLLAFGASEGVVNPLDMRNSLTENEAGDQEAVCD